MTSRTSVAPGNADPQRWPALAVIAAATLMVVLDASIVNIALPQVQTALRIDDQHRQWIVTAYTLAFGGLLLLGGRVADFLGRKRVFIAALIGLGAGRLGGRCGDAVRGAGTARGLCGPAGPGGPLVDCRDLHA